MSLEKSTSASIINIGSIYGFLGPDLSLYESTDMNNPAAYAASKGGLLQLTRWMATALAPKFVLTPFHLVVSHEVSHKLLWIAMFRARL